MKRHGYRYYRPSLFGMALGFVLLLVLSFAQGQVLVEWTTTLITVVLFLIVDTLMHRHVFGFWPWDSEAVRKLDEELDAADARRK